jgi:hypothetical protein
MTTLTRKLHDVTKQLQHLTVWRPSEHDPLVELDWWRDEMHQAIEQIYKKKRLEIELIMEKHEREFMRQIVRQRTSLDSIRKRHGGQHHNGQQGRTQNDESVLADLQKIENDIRTKLGRGEVLVKTIPFDLDDCVMVHLKTYFAHTSTTHRTELLDLVPPPQKRTVSQDYEHWLHDKSKQRKITIGQSQEAEKQLRERVSADQRNRTMPNQITFDQWSHRKKQRNPASKKAVTVDATSKPELPTQS